MLLNLLHLPSVFVLLGSVFFLALSEKFLKSSINTISENIIYAGAIFTLVGAIGATLAVAEPMELGPAISVSMLCFAYAVAIKTIINSDSSEYSETSDSYVLRGISAIGFMGLVIFSMSRAGPIELFFNGPLVVVIIVLLIILYCAGRMSKKDEFVFLYERLSLLGFFVVFLSIILALKNFQDPKEVGLAIGFGLFGLLYVLLIKMVTRILLPHIVLKVGEKSKSDVLTFVIPFLFAISTIFLILFSVV